MNASSRVVVLVVEDEPILRMMATDLVEEAGFAAVEAASADEAVAILEGRKDIQVVFTDIMMPGSMDGLKLAITIRERWTAINLILTSGNSQEAEVILPAGCVFFAKPYDRQAVTSTLRKMAA